MAEKVVLLDDDSSSRNVIKVILSTMERYLEVDLKIYTTSNGVEGLGYIFVTRPDIIIIDSTLPKYSGRELVDFISTNANITKQDKLIIVLVESDSNLDLPKNFIVLRKSNKNFLEDLTSSIFHYFGKDREDPTMNLVERMKYFLGNWALRWSNRSRRVLDLLEKANIIGKLVIYLLWIFFQFLASLNLALLRIFAREVKDDNIELEKKDLRKFRTKHYPTLAGSLAALILVAFQCLLFVAGGLVIFNTRIESFLALVEKGEVGLNLKDSNFDSNLVEYADSSIRLKGLLPEGGVVQEGISGSTQNVSNEGEQINSTPNEPIGASNSTDQTSQESEPIQEVPVSTPEGVLGAEDNSLPPVSELPITQASTIRYSTENPEVVINQEIKYTKLSSILEESNSNSFQSSVATEYSPGLQSSQITYQLSPNKKDWYYYGLEGWEKTEAGFVSSNVIQEVNLHLQGYVEKVGAGNMYIKIYLHSEGSEQTSLKRLQVDREIELISEGNVAEDEEKVEISTVELNPAELVPMSYPLSYPTSDTATSVEEEPLSYPVSYVGDGSTETLEENLPTPVILNASFANSNKVVIGYIDTETQNSKVNGQSVEEVYVIPNEELGRYSVSVYYTSSRDITTNATHKGELIGTADIQRISVNGIEQYVFEMITPAADGGYVTAELTYTVKTQNFASLQYTSLPSFPVENSTFTVNESGDQSDVTPGDGICDRDAGTPGVQCTLRAAIQEANALAGSDNIYFDIPTTDSGYRDYDLPDTPNSGDSTGGDDYWTIRPTSLLPNITGTVILDGATQTTNQGDFNASGPEIELKGNGTLTSGLSIQSGATDSAVNGVVINRFVTQIYVYGNGFTLTNSYLGTDVKSITGYGGQTNGIIVGSTNVIIGNTVADGNVISGTGASGNGINLACGSTGTAKVHTIRGNKIGISYDGSVEVGNRYGIYLYGDCDTEIGGDSPSHRNYLGGNSYTGIFMLPTKSGVPDIDIYNNFFGTNLDGTLARPNEIDNIFLYEGLDVAGPQNIFDIGAQGKGNLMRFSYVGIILRSDRRIDIVANTVTDDAGIGIMSTILPGDPDNLTNVYNNFIGSGVSADPYFGLNIPTDTFPYESYGVSSLGASPEIKGNYIVNHGVGISTDNIIDWMDDENSRLTSSVDRIATPTIGGPLSFDGSLCSNSEKNCIINSQVAGIFNYDTVPGNESSLFPDNFFQNNGVDGESNIIQSWRGLFELHSGNMRRTDFPDQSVQLDFTSNHSKVIAVDPSSYIDTVQNYGENYTLNCSDPTTCPAGSGIDGYTSSIAAAVLYGPPFRPFKDFYWEVFYVTEYQIDSQGNKIEYSTTDNPTKFELPHFASREFAYNGKKDTFEAYLDTTDRGEPWTNNPTATRNIATKDFSRYQTMEVEYVDANPILQDDGTYVITVDSTTDEDNVSLGGFDDGGGAYSGGGVNGVNGLSNGKTSFREAIIVANNFSQPTTIAFNIPTSDPGWNTVDYPNTFVIKPTANLPAITANKITIDGESQTQFSGDTNLEQTQYLAEYGANDYTTGPEIILAGSSGVVRLVEFLGVEIKINRLGFYNQNNQINSGGLRPVQFGPTAAKIEVTSCTFDSNGNGNIGTYQITSPELILRSNVFKNTAPNSPGDRDAIEGRASKGWIENNIIISNDAAGIGLYNSSSSGTLYIRNNYIIDSGTIESGAEGRNGIVITCNNPLKISIEGNLINQNALDGITILRDCQGVTMRANKVFANGGENIDIADLTFGGGVPDLPNLLGDGIDENDPGDSDSGPNNLQNSPVISKVEYVGSGQYKVSGDLSSNSSESPFNIEICESYENTLNQGGCIRTLGTTTSSSPWTTIVTIPGDDGTQNRIFSALATNKNGSTSEFSQNYGGSVTLMYNISLVYPINGASISDTTPQLDWNQAQKDNVIAPDVFQYDIYLDGSFLASVSGTVTNFQLVNGLGLGKHTWQVIAYRKMGNGSLMEIGRSITESFVVVELDYTFTPVYPVGVQIDDYTPRFEWTGVPEASGATGYELVIIKLDEEGNEETTIRKNVAGITNTFYQMVEDESLAPGQYEWYVIAFKTDANGQKLEVSRTEVVDFEILSLEPVSYGVGAPSDIGAEAQGATLITLLPLGISAILAGLVILATALSGISGLGNTLPILIGMLFRKKRKYWGVIFDEKTYKPIPFAMIALRNLSSNKIYQSVSDLEGKYGLLVEESGDYSFSVRASGYEPYGTTINVNKDSDIALDIPLSRIADGFRIEINLRKYLAAILKTVQIVLGVLMIIGFIYTLSITLENAVFLNILILFAYFLLFAINLAFLIWPYIGRVKGRVIDAETNEGIIGVRVRFYRINKLVDVAMTNKDGRIKVNVPTGEYVISAGKAGYEQVASGLLKVRVVKSGQIDEMIKMKRRVGQAMEKGEMVNPFQ